MEITEKQIEKYLTEVKSAVRKGNYRIAQNSCRQDNSCLLYTSHQYLPLLHYLQEKYAGSPNLSAIVLP